MKLPQAHLWAILPALASFYSLSQALPLKESSVSVQSPDAAAPNQDRPVKFFELNLTEARGAPDGYNRLLYHVNGQGPVGPEIVVDEGDQLQILVNNHLSISTTMHWHGVSQLSTFWNDGVPGVTQDLIPPGKQFLYDFPVDQHGLYFYHAHNRMYQGDGLHGPIRVKPRSDREHPFHMITDDTSEIKEIEEAVTNAQTLFVSDWRRESSEEALISYETSGVEPICISSILLNGRGRVQCPGADFLSQFETEASGPYTAKGCVPPTSPLLAGASVDADTIDASMVLNDTYYSCDPTDTPYSVVQVDRTQGWAAVGIINGGSTYRLRVSFDNHPMWVYERDGQYVTPTRIESINIPLGERVQVLLKLDPSLGWKHTIRVATNDIAMISSGYGLLEYVDGPGDSTNATCDTLPEISDNTKVYLGYNGAVLDNFIDVDPFTQGSFPATSPPPEANRTITLTLSRELVRVWAMNKNTGWDSEREWQSPLLWDPREITNLTASAEPYDVVDLIMELPPPQPPHPIHKHGERAWLIGQGIGERNWTTVEEALQVDPNSFNLQNPYFSDGFDTLPAETDTAWMVIRWQISPDEKAPIPIHCHIDAHLGAGMMMVLMQDPDHFPTVPDEYANGDGIPAGWTKPTVNGWSR